MYVFFFFFFNDTATTEIYTTVHTLSLHDALPISKRRRSSRRTSTTSSVRSRGRSRTSTRSEEHTSEPQSRTVISYAVFCLKKKKKESTVKHASARAHIRKRKGTHATD